MLPDLPKRQLASYRYALKRANSAAQSSRPLTCWLSSFDISTEATLSPNRVPELKPRYQYANLRKHTKPNAKHTCQGMSPPEKHLKILGLHANTLRKYADDGRIATYRTASGQRRFDVDSYLGDVVEAKPSVICYCRVSSHAQKPDLERQVESMRERFPEADIVQDIGSALDDQR